MEGFTKLEEAALRDVCLRFPDDKTALMAQLTTAKVRSRENTGVGFYTRIDVERESSAALKGERMRSGGWAHIDGLDNPMGFILWLRDGYADCLEGFTVADSTVGIDLATISFALPFLDPK
jgi:hypothetical protein